MIADGRSRTLVAAAAGLWLVACGDAGMKPPPRETATSASFSPTAGTSSAGQPVDVWWTHRLNGGAPVAVTVDGATGTATFGDRTTTISGGGTLRVVTRSLDLILGEGAGRVTSHVDTHAEGTLSAGPPSALVSEATQETQTLSGGRTTTATLMGDLVFGAPFVDVADRPDLDQLAVGATEQVDVHTTLTVTQTATVQGQPTQTASNTKTTDGTSRWFVVEKVPSLTVLGKVYARVVRLDVSEVTTDLTTGNKTSSTSSFWYAAGIGLVRSSQALPGTGTTPVIAELVDTNLAAQ